MLVLALVVVGALTVFGEHAEVPESNMRAKGGEASELSTAIEATTDSAANSRQHPRISAVPRIQRYIGSSLSVGRRHGTRGTWNNQSARRT